MTNILWQDRVNDEVWEQLKEETMTTAEEQARKVYDEVVARAWEVYEKEVAPTRKVYGEVEARAKEVREEAVAQAVRVYERAEAKAYRDYRKAVAQAQKVYGEAIKDE